MNLENSFTGKSLISELDPRIRILICFLFAITVALSTSGETFAVAGVLSLGLAIFAKLNLKKLIVRLFFVNIFIVFLWFFLPFTTPGNTIWSFHGLEASREGVLLCARISARANIIILLLISLISTIPLENLGFALQKLYFPEKLVFILLFTIRYLYVIESEKDRLLNAAKARGFSPGTNLHTYKTIACFIGMLLVKSIDRAEMVHQAMICKGFSGRFHAINHFSLRKRDVCFFVMGMIIVAFITTIETGMEAIRLVSSK